MHLNCAEIAELNETMKIRKLTCEIVMLIPLCSQYNRPNVQHSKTWSCFSWIKLRFQNKIKLSSIYHHSQMTFSLLFLINKNKNNWQYLKHKIWEFCIQNLLILPKKNLIFPNNNVLKGLHRNLFSDLTKDLVSLFKHRHIKGV